ncbi:MAG: hypothetical protein EOO10_21285 [Chitinophagaceae bacterium]|nr:MAG: hypothetical protein EOO10_21285 [Chitinophagaceae bacterium]
MNTYPAMSQDAKQELQLRRTLEAIEQYREAKYNNQLENQPLEELVYELLGADKYEDQVAAYEQNLVSLLSFLLKPDITAQFQKLFHKNVQTAIADMLLNLYDFFRQLNSEYYLLQLLLVSVKRGEEKFSTLHRLEGEYKAKLEAYTLERMQIEVMNKHQLHSAIVPL